MRLRAPRLLLALAALLPGCAGDAPLESAARQPRARPVAAAAPAAPTTEFDGVYAGTLALQPDRTRRCPEAPAGEREITVRNGRATLALNPRVRQALTGTVGPDGSVRMADSIDRTIATSGVFTEEGFQGEHRNGLCSYSVQMTKRGG